MFKILMIIEDDELARNFKDQFTRLNCTVQRLHNMNSLGEKLMSVSPQLVISSLKGTHIDGLKVAEHVLKRPKKPKLILIKSEGDEVETSVLMKLKVDKLITREGVAKMVQDLATTDSLASKDEEGALIVKGKSSAPKPKLTVVTGKDKKYDEILKKSSLSMGDKTLDVAKIRKFKKEQAAQEQEDGLDEDKKKFVEALFKES